MGIENAFQGSLFVNDFLQESITRSADWTALDDAALDAFRDPTRRAFDRFPITQTPNESQTEDDLIWPILELLGWTSSLRQQNLTPRGREDVPDGLLFADDAAKDHANGFAEEWKRYEFGLAAVESKRWRRPLDRRSGPVHRAAASPPERSPCTGDISISRPAPCSRATPRPAPSSR